MVRLVVVALLLCVARADEYGGAGMPLYDDSAEYDPVPPAGNAAVDYRGHSPDAPAPLDYKYEEERQGNTEKPTLDNIESDTWKKNLRKQRGRRDRDEPLDVEMDADSIPKWRNQQRAQSRLADDKLRAQDELARRRHGRHERSREDTDSPISSDYLDKSDFRNDKNDILDEVERFTLKETVEERVGKSKSKDRFHNNYVKTPKIDDMDLEEDLIADRKLKKSRERPRGLRGRTKARERNKWYRPVIATEEDVNEEEPIESTRFRSEPKDFVYYDMRRVEKIKKKLPKLLRRTTTPAPPSRSTTTDDLLDLWMAPRRAGDEPIGPSVTNNVRSSSLLPITTTTTTTTKTTSTTTTTSTTITESTELSIAEKSRLSILKKSQKKENFKGEIIKKPPILLHVTSNVPTIVMVEPPASTNSTPWMRAQSVPYHPPKHLEKVKRLMRHKLVAGAKNIKDLTDNWDDMVCDYIDESLINSAYETSPTLIWMALALFLPL